MTDQESIDLLKQILAKPLPSMRTREQYSAQLKRIDPIMDLLEYPSAENLLRLSSSKSRFYLSKSAMLNRLAEQIKLLEKRIRFTSSEEALILGTFEIEDQVERYRRISEIKYNSETSTPKRSNKRQGLNSLPPDWRHLLFEASHQSKYHIPILVLLLSGCRPFELELGVKIYADTDGNGRTFVKIVIPSAKISSNDTPPKREMEYFLKGENFTSLSNTLYYKTMEQPSRQMLVKVERRKNLSKFIESLGAKLWSRRGLTAYSLRHAFASDIKRQFDAADVALMLGHTSTKSIKAYGHSAIGRHWMPITPDLWRASHAVKIHPTIEEYLTSRRNLPKIALD